MANLETLELTINGSAEKASQGIDTLISRLSSLASAITRPLAGLTSFNSELQKTLKIAKSIQMPNLNIKAKVSNSISSRRDRMYRPEGDRVEPEEAMRLTQEASKIELLRMKYGGMMERFIPNAVAGNFDSKQLADGAMQIQRIQSEIDQANQSANETTPIAEKIKEGFGNMTEGVSRFFSKVKRIATTMLIRSAIRNLIKDIKEGVNNLYEWSKLNNGEFAKSFDTLKAKSQQLKNSLGAAIAPAIQAAIPIINALASAAISAFNWVNQLIALLTGQSYWTKATENLDAYTDSVKSAGGAAKEWLASFDELNVMTSGGGGGGGGASGVTSDMFENTTKFNETLKEVVNFIKTNFEDIKIIAEGIGIAILSWKLAKGFLDTIPALSKIAGLIGIGATIAITLKANYMLTNEYLKTGKEGWLIASALTSAIGATAAGVIAKQIFGKKAALYTIGFTLVFSALTDIVANVQNTNVDAFSKEGLLTSISAALKAGAGIGVIMKAFNVSTGTAILAAAGGAALTFLISTGLKIITSKNKIEWGNIVLTETQIKDYVESKMFETNVNVKVDQIKTILGTKASLEESVTTAIGELNTQLDILSLGIDTGKTSENIKAILGDEENGLIKDVKDLCNINIDALKLTFATIDLLDGEGNAIDADVLAKGITGWQNVEIMMENKGKELTRLLTQAAKGELTPEMEQYTKQLLEEVRDITTKVAKAKEFGEATVAFKEKALEAMSQGSFEGIITAFKDYSTNYETTIREALKENIASWYALSNLTTDPDLKAEYIRIAEELQSGLEETVSEEMKKQTAPGKTMILDWIFGQVGTIEGDIGRNITERLKGYGLTSERFTEMIRKALVENGMSGAVIPVMDVIGFSGWDLLSQDLKKKFLANVTISEQTIKEIAKAGVSATELVELVEWDKVKGMTQESFITSMVSAFGTSGIAAIKHRFPDIKASTIIQLSGWQDFTDTQKLQFVDAIGKAFSNQDAINAAKNAGIDLEKAIKSGMNSQNEDIRKMAEKWAEIMGIEIRGGDYTVKPKVKDTDVNDTKNTITSGVSNIIAWVKSKAGWSNGYPNNLKTDIESQNPTVKAIVGLLNGAAAAVQSAIENQIKPTITATVTASGIDKIAQAFKKALSAKVALITDTGKQVGSATIAVRGLATGGLVNGGDLFIANENGVPEMIGRFGNQTGVANQGQIIAGISKGVYEANEQQNALLREQNALLRAIYEKDDGSGMPGVSAALGRQIKRSLDAYNGLVGG